MKANITIYDEEKCSYLESHSLTNFEVMALLLQPSETVVAVGFDVIFANHGHKGGTFVHNCPLGMHFSAAHMIVHDFFEGRTHKKKESWLEARHLMLNI